MTQVAPSQHNSPVLIRAAEILAQVGEELAFVEEGGDTGLLPINSLVMDFEELPLQGAPAVLASGLAAVRALLDQILDGTGKFTGESIRFLNEWHAWMSSVLTAWDRGGEMPPVPATWNQSKAGAAPVPAANPAAASSKAPTLQPVADEPAIRLNLADDSELLREFHSESLELLQAIEQGVLLLEENPTEAGTINSIFRAFHTFKGSAGLLHLDALRDLAHDLESLLDAARRAELNITSVIIDLILAGGDTLKQFTNEIGAQLQGVKPGEPIVVPTRPLRQRVRAALNGNPLPVTGLGQPATPVSPTPKEPKLKVSENAAQQAATPGSGTAVPSETAAAPDKVRSESSAKAESATGFVKLDTRKLDSLVDLVG